MWQNMTPLPLFDADLAHVRDQSEAASQRVEAVEKKAREQQLQVEAETGLREMRIQVAEQEAMTSTSRAINAERALAEAAAERENLHTQVGTLDMHTHTLYTAYIHTFTCMYRQRYISKNVDLQFHMVANIFTNSACNILKCTI